MAVPSDASNTIKLISDYWPDLQFQRDDILHGNPDFNKRFYTYLINDLNEKIAVLINEELDRDNFDELNYSDEVKLYCKVVNVFKRMQQNSLNLVDFYLPAGKKMYPLVKFSIHFIIYANNCVDDLLVIITDYLRKLTDCENNKVLEQQLLEEYAEIVENLAHTDNVFERLMQKSEEVKPNHLKMLEEKTNDERKAAQMALEMKELQSKIDNFEYELQLLEEKENELQEAMISENELEHLKKTENCLEAELQQLHDVTNGTWDNINDLENIQRYEEIATFLTNFELDSLNVCDSQKVRQDEAQYEHTLKKNQEELNYLNKTASDSRKKQEVLKQMLEKTQAVHVELKTKLTIEEQEERECLLRETEKCAANFEENQRVKTLMVHIQENIHNLGSDERRLNATVAQEYSKILMMDKKTTTKYYNMLIDLKRRSQ